MCKRVPFFSFWMKGFDKRRDIFLSTAGIFSFALLHPRLFVQFFLRSSHKFTWLPRLCRGVETQVHVSPWLVSLPAAFHICSFVSLLSNLSVPLLSGCDVASAEGVYTHVAQNSRLMQTSGDKSKYEHFIKIPPWSLNLESPKSASRERSQPILEQHASCFGFDHFSQCNHRHWGGGLDSRVYWKDISSSLLTQWRGKQQNSAQQESRLSRDTHTHFCCDTF